MEVVDAPFRAGDLRYGYQAVADNLPNDARIHAEKGTKKIFFKNFMDARVDYVILPIAQNLMRPRQAEDASGEGYLDRRSCTRSPMDSAPPSPSARQASRHQRGHRPRLPASKRPKPTSSACFGPLAGRPDALPAARPQLHYASYVAGIFRTLRFGTGEAHGRAEMMEFNVLLEHNALTLNPAPDGQASTYTIDYATMPEAIASLTHQLLTFEAQGDRAGAEAWMTKYDVMPPTLTRALESTTAIPVDITPDFELNRGVRP